MQTDFLKKEFLDEVRDIFGEDCDAFLATYNEKPFRGISINTLKSSYEQLTELLPFELKKTPMYKNGCYIDSGLEGVGSSPLHHAGAFYVQEPSASAPVTLLDVHEGERILDLCAAPGGKSAQIAALLNHSGLLWSNEIVRSRARILLSNFERMGVRSAVVSACRPDILCKKLSGYFDKVLVDAPCSGEGMFRKNHEASNEWSREHVKSCAERQLAILESAAVAVRVGGVLVYSTCTFSREENEGVAGEFLNRHREFSADIIDMGFGRKSDVGGIRISPLEGGEGQFMIRFKKNDGTILSKNTYDFAKGNASAKLAEDFIKVNFKLAPRGKIQVIGEKAYLFPEELPSLSGLSIVRAGVLIGDIKKDRLDPSHAFFSAFTPDYFNSVLDLKISDERVGMFLEGAEIDCDNVGYTLLAIEGISTGFGKASAGRLKNKYPKGLRQKR